MPVDRELPANHPDSPLLLLDLTDGSLPWKTTKDQFLHYLVIVAGDNAAVLWDRDVAPQLEPDDAPWSMHDGGPRDGKDLVLNAVHTCVRVYLRHHAAAWHRGHLRWYVVKASGARGASDQTVALQMLFRAQLDRGH